ncbi:MAG: alpha/beta hydrolase [Akkermansiaceae bacterium]|nr:alpha/beta hydrolase [Armatimonadota bacterium]
MVRFIHSNGARLAYQEAGQGIETMILVHGWVDRHETMLPLAARFAKRYRVIAVDLRGHGLSEKTEKGYGIPSLADDIAETCRQLHVRKPILVGHSLGGTIALEVAARHPDLPRAVVALEGVILMPESVRAATRPLGEALRGPHWKDAMRGFIQSNSLPTDDRQLIDTAMREFERLPRHVHTGIFDAVTGWDAEQAARKCRVPILYVDAGSGLSDLAKFQALCPRLVTGKTVGVGHNQMIATPEQVTAMIERFVIVSLKNNQIATDIYRKGYNYERFLCS